MKPMPGPYEIWVMQWPETEDGIAIVTLEVNGRLLASDVVMDDESAGRILSRFRDVVMAEC